MKRRKRKNGFLKALLLRSMAGAAPRRRGTILVVILGALALLSVITVAYVAVGKGDRHTAAVVKPRRRCQRDGRASRRLHRHRHHRRRRALHLQVRPAGRAERPATPAKAGTWRSRPGSRARTTSRSSMRSIASDSRPSAHPRRSRSRARERHQRPSALPGSDPWLADAYPTWLNYDIDTPNGYLDIMDWGTSATSPPTGASSISSTCAATSTAQPGGGFDPNDGLPRLSQGLTLFSDNGVPFISNPFAGYPSTNSQLDFGESATLDMPAHWDSRQQHMFRRLATPPADRTRPTTCHTSTATPTATATTTARWQVLVDASDEDNSVLDPAAERAIPLGRRLAHRRPFRAAERPTRRPTSRAGSPAPTSTTRSA